MGRVRRGDYRAILEFLRELYAPCTLDDFRDRLVHSLRKLIPCELVTYDEMNPARHTSIDRGSPAGAFPPAVSRLWQRVMHEHPVLMHCRRTADLHAYRISDFLSERAYHRLALYHEYYRTIGVEDALCKGIWVSGPVVIGCAFHRGRRSFTDRDRLIFDLIGPHLTQAWRNARELSRLRDQMAALSKAVETLDDRAVVLGPGSRVRHMTPQARSILEEFFGNGSAGDHRLPDLLARWLRERKKQFAADHLPQPLAPLTVERGEARLAVRLLRSASQDLLLLRAQRPALARATLEALGLTPREAEVLAWVAQGKTNVEIGAILGASPRTVQKHLEHIFAKLGVETRTAAAAIALQAQEVADD